MPKRLMLLCLGLTAFPVMGQNTFVVDSWTGVETEEVRSDESGALVLGDVDVETNLASRRPAVDHTGSTARVTDGNASRNSAWNSLTSSAFNFFVQVDLEQPRLVNRVVVVPVTGNDIDFIKGYSIQTSLDNVVFTEQVSNVRNQNNLVDTTFAGVVTRYVRVQVKAIDRVHNVQIGDIEVYGGGFLGSGVYISDPSDLGVAQDKNFGQVRWQADIPAGAQLSLQFRTGPTATPNGNWSDWTEPSIAGDGILLDLPEPNRFLQYQVNFSTSGPNVGPRLQRLEVDFGSPLVANATAVVLRNDDGVAEPDTLPNDEVPVGVNRRFLYTIETEVGGGAGFDVLRLLLPNRGQIEEVALDGAVLSAGADYSVTADGPAIDIAFSQLLGSDARLEVRFNTILFDELNIFRAQLLSRNDSNNPQQVAAGTGRENALAVFGVGFNEKVLDKGGLTVAPNPFSPDGDGRFDEVFFRYELAKLSDPRPVTIRIYDLTGRPVRRLELQQKSGTQVVAWDGRDNNGDPVPPGLFLFQINVATGDGIQLNGAVGVAY